MTARAEQRRCVLTDKYDEIYSRMKLRYEQESGARIDEASDIAIRLKVLAGEIYNAQTNLEWLKRQMFASTATGEYLDYIAMQRGLERKAATKAKGQLTFRLENTLNYAVPIPKGTVVATDSEVPVRIVTTEDSEIPQATYSVSVNAEAELAGYRGNIYTGTAVVPVSVPAIIYSVTNQSGFMGGTDEESDTTLRERIRNTFTSVPNGMNKSYYKKLALSLDGVEKAGVIERYTGTGTAGVFVCGNNDIVSDETLEKLNRLLKEEQCLGAAITAYKGSLRYYDLKVTVTAKAGFDDEEVKFLLTDAFTDYIGTVPMGGKLYLSGIGRYLLDTGCIENYEFDYSMKDVTASGAQCFTVGDIDIEVKH